VETQRDSINVGQVARDRDCGCGCGCAAVAMRECEVAKYTDLVLFDFHCKRKRGKP
jgi:hypothetical protein